MDFRSFELFTQILCVWNTITAGQEKIVKWKETLLYQFHDILPGSSIQRVYDESIDRYHAMLAETETMIAVRMQKLAEGRLTAFNSLAWPRQAIVKRNDGFYRMAVPAMGFTQ